MRWLTNRTSCVTMTPLPSAEKGIQMKKWMILALIGAMVMTMFACGAKDEPQETTVPADTEGDVVTYYHGDKFGDVLISETTLVPRLTAQALVDLLIEQKIIPEGTRVRNFKRSSGIITLDLSKEFEEQAQSLGSTGEYVLVGSLVNTFLTTYEAQGMDLTTEGRDLATGHNVYDYTLGFFE